MCPVMEAPTPSLRPLIVPLAVGLLMTGGAAWLICKPPMRPSLSWLELVALTLLYVGLVMGVQAAALTGLSKAFGDHIDVPGIQVSGTALIEGSWLSAAWMPLFVLLVRESSVWAAIVPPLAALPVTAFLRKNRLAANASIEIPLEAPAANATPALFRMDESPSLLRSVLPPAIAAVALESGVAAALVDYGALAGLLLAIGTIVFAWRYPIKAKASEQPEMWLGRVWRLAIVILFTGTALLPFLKYKSFGGMNAFLHANRPSLPAVQAKEVKPRSGGHYSGVILYLPQKPKEKIVAPAPMNTNAFGPAHGRPMVIPFDGVYWYFQPPDDRPEADAHVIHGDPTKTGVHSTEYLPLLMQAHQELGSSMAMDCCRTLRVLLRNGDNLRGMIYLEVILKDTMSKQHSSMSLGSLYLKSSEDGTSNASVARPDGRSVEETLSYPIPESARGRRFNEITLVFQPSQERSLSGTRVAIEQFVFEP